MNISGIGDAQTKQVNSITAMIKKASDKEKTANKNSDINAVIVDLSSESKNELFKDVDNQMKMLYEELEAARQSGEAMSEATEELGKIMLIVMRIMEGAQVPPSDEKKVLEYDPKLYQMAKSMASMNKNKANKKYDALFEDEDDKESTVQNETQSNNKSEKNVSDGNGAEDADTDIQVVVRE